MIRSVMRINLGVVFVLYALTGCNRSPSESRLAHSPESNAGYAVSATAAGSPCSICDRMRVTSDTEAEPRMINSQRTRDPSRYPHRWQVSSFKRPSDMLGWRFRNGSTNKVRGGTNNQPTC